MFKLIVAAMLVCGCAVDSDDVHRATTLPSCASLGCPLKPSGDPDTWQPCEPDATECYCPTDAGVEACELAR